MDTHPEVEMAESILRAIVDNPADVGIERSVDDMGVLLSVRVNRADMGKVIGKGGEMAGAIRLILKAIGARNDNRVNMKIVEPDGGSRRFGREDHAKDDQAARTLPA